jgi:hypothetical protein
MRLAFIRKTGTSGDGGCPALYRTDRGTYVVQGVEVSDPDALNDVRDMAPGELLVEVPADVLFPRGHKGS